MRRFAPQGDRFPTQLRSGGGFPRWGSVERTLHMFMFTFGICKSETDELSFTVRQAYFLLRDKEIYQKY